MRKQFKLPISHRDIADYLGLTIETVSRTFTRLQAEGLIDIVSQGQMVIRDPFALEKLASGLPVGSLKLSSEIVEDRRRPGRIHNISPALIPILRNPTAGAVAGDLCPVVLTRRLQAPITAFQTAGAVRPCANAGRLAVPLAIRIHEGVVWSNRDRRTLLDKMLALLGIVAIAEPCYFVADAYYAARKIVTGLLKQNNHLVTRVKSNAVAYTAHQQRGPRKRGRPKVYGRKVKLKSLLDDPKGRQQANSPVYGERRVVIQYKVRDLLWRPAGRLVRFVAVIHPTRGSCLLMCTDTSLAAIEIIRLYGLRFKIEHTFKQAVRLIGSFSYHFWMSDMKPLRRRSGNQHLHRASPEYRDAVRRKLHAYHVFIQAAVVCQGLLQYLAVAFPQRVWDAFGSWLRTIRPGIPPSELVVANALRQSMPEFLLNSATANIFAKFVIERQDTDKMEAFRLAS